MLYVLIILITLYKWIDSKFMISVLLVVFLYVYKVKVIGDLFERYDSDSHIGVAVNDAVLIIPVLFLLLWSARDRTLNSIAMRLLAFIVICFYVIDGILIGLLKTRLYIDDIKKFIFEVEVLGTGVNYIMLLFFGLMLLCFFIFLFSTTNRSQSKLLRVLFASWFLFFILSMVPPKSIRNIFYINFVQANFEAGYREKYTNDFVSEQTYRPSMSCEPYFGDIPSKIMIILFESWSNYHSSYFGEIHNWTPKLDKIARNNISFRNLYANGFSTEDGLYSLFIGKPLLANSAVGKLDGMNSISSMDSEYSLVSELGMLGFNSHFITSGDLRFLDKGIWLKDIGFNNVIGADDFPRQSKRYMFNSVSDEVLFDRAFEEVSSLEGKQLVVIENVTTHSPYLVPRESGPLFSEKDAFMYSDEHISRFITKLDDKDWFVMVISDHRAMTPLTKSEIEKDGLLSSSKIPGFMIWNENNLEINQALQQSDILSTLLDSFNRKSCFGDIKGTYFPIDSPRSARCIVHKRGDNRELLSLLCDGNELNVRLNGNNTTQVSGVTDSMSVSIVNYLRIEQQYGE